MGEYRCRIRRKPGTVRRFIGLSDETLDAQGLAVQVVRCVKEKVGVK